MKNVKKLTAIILSLALFLGISVSSNALSIEGGVEPLKNQFVAGEGPVVDEIGRAHV